MKHATLALEDGTVFRGRAFGAEIDAGGEVVFNTALTGYQEILTDPSYRGQIVVMTCPEIGNVGVNPHDMESGRVQVEAFVVRELSPVPSSWRSEGRDLDGFLHDHGVPGLAGIDTRRLVRILRDGGAQRGVILRGSPAEGDAVARARAVPSIVGADLATGASCKIPHVWEEGVFRFTGSPSVPDRDAPLVVALDFGIKHNILRLLTEQGLRVLVMPAGSSAADIRAHRPAGLFLSNGPGDPDAVTTAIATVCELYSELPLFGICLGHQILGLALGARTYKLKFGHRGANHPVQDDDSRKIEVSSQNHGFAVDAQGLPAELEITHLNLNDGTVSGMRHRTLPVFSVQYHPEASPGPHDSRHLFARFAEAVRTRARAS